MPNTTDCANCPRCQARATVYRQLIEVGVIDITAAAASLAQQWSSPAPEHASRNAAVAAVLIALEQLETMPRKEILQDAKDLGICATARHALGRQIGHKRVRAEYVAPGSS